MDRKAFLLCFHFLLQADTPIGIGCWSDCQWFSFSKRIFKTFFSVAGKGWQSPLPCVRLRHRFATLFYPMNNMTRNVMKRRKKFQSTLCCHIPLFRARDSVHGRGTWGKLCFLVFRNHRLLPCIVDRNFHHQMYKVDNIKNHYCLSLSQGQQLGHI